MVICGAIFTTERMVPPQEQRSRVLESSRVVQPALFADLNGAPEGLRYEPEFVSRAVEAELVARLQDLPLRPFQFGVYEGKRRVASFGFRYDFAQKRLQGADPIPAWLTPIIGSVETFNELPAGSVGQVLCTE